MNNKANLLKIIDLAERGPLLTGEAEQLRDAVNLLDELANTLDKISAGYDHERYEPESTQQLRVINNPGSGQA